MKILFFGDVIGKIGRKAIAAVVADYKAEYQPDLIIANAENSAHGSGITSKTLQEMIDAGVQFFTAGNHTLAKPEAAQLLADPTVNLIRPANYSAQTPGVGYKAINTPAGKVLVINLIAQVFMRQEVDHPFSTIDEILKSIKAEDYAAIFVDFHGEATSEKVAMGWHLDGRVSVVVGTHTHVPTADIKILPNGTAYVTDVGMVGARDSIIGDVKEPILHSFLTGEPHKIDVPETGLVDVSAVLVEVDPQTRKAKSIKRVDKTVTV